MSAATGTKPSLRPKLFGLYGLLAAFNLGAWGWALLTFWDRPALLSVAAVTYGLGLRHAVDADHIAAIDNVTRKLMQQGQRPLTVGFYFALGHSSIVILVTALVALAAGWVRQFNALGSVTGLLSTIVSAFFLLAIAGMNIAIFRAVYRSHRRVRAGGAYWEEDLDMLLASRGLLSRLFRPLFAMVSRSWHMAPLGLLFGLGFDTATEVAIFGVGAAQTARGLPMEAMMIFPALFAAGMTLVDTTDGIMMLGAYEWAFVKPIRKLYYNMMITLVSIAVALVIGGIETLSLIGDQFSLRGALWQASDFLAGNINDLGFLTIAIFAGAWALSCAIYRARRLDALPVTRRPLG